MSEDRLIRIEAKLDRMATDVGDLKTDVSVLKTDVGVLKTDVRVLKDGQGALEASLHRLYILHEATQDKVSVNFEALQGLREQMDRGFVNVRKEFREELAPIKLALQPRLRARAKRRA